jgi:hypothetical protein
MESSLGQSVGAVAPRHESARDQEREESFAMTELSENDDAFPHTLMAADGLPISPGRFELPTEIFQALLQDARALMPTS